MGPIGDLLAMKPRRQYVMEVLPDSGERFVEYVLIWLDEQDDATKARVIKALRHHFQQWE